MSLPIVQTINLNKSVQSGNQALTILDNVNVTIQKAETVAIVGVSGSGKSTLLGLLASFRYAPQGVICKRD